jgi:hypothetical protein
MARCDTCGKTTDKVYRVVVDKNYDRSGAVARYNCRECFDRKNAERAAPLETAPASPR